MRTDVANCFYPIYIIDGKIKGFGAVCDEGFHPQAKNIIRKDGVIEIYPIDSSGIKRKWFFARETIENIIDELSVKHESKTNRYDVTRTKSNFGAYIHN